MGEYARQQTARLLERMTLALEKAARDGDADSIHDVRVAMRRLSRCLRVFAQFYPHGAAKKIRRRISALMALAGAARDCDISIELVGRAGVVRHGAIVAQLTERRIETGRALLREIRRWERRDYLRQWRQRLEL
jgi:CHAD domain-containing protein